MPNYRYNSSDCMRRGNYNGQNRQTYPLSSQPVHRIYNDKQSECDELNGMTLAMAYVPWQEWQNLYNADQGLHRGTIFSELDKPFWGTGGCMK